MTITRRTFVIQSLLGATALVASQVARADTAKVLESDPQAISLGYKDDASKVDKAKFSKYVAGEKCASCTLFTATSAGVGSCAVFAGKQVNANGWCSAYVKKA